MDAVLEKRNPGQDLGGLCECFIYEGEKRQRVAQLHMHQHFELLYCLSGGFEITARQSTHLLNPGDVALIHPMEAHTTRSLSEGSNSYLVLKFMPESLYDTGKQLYGLKYIFPYIHFSDESASVYTARQLENSRMNEMLMRILEERSRQDYGYEIALHACISQVLLWFLRAWNSERRTQTDESSLRRMQQVQAFIDAHLDEGIKAEEAAAELGMGLSTFSRFFAQTAGMSFPAYVRSQRLSRVAALLAQSSLSITDIAMETGFSSTSYLILCFRKQYGVTPSQFRRLSSAE